MSSFMNPVEGPPKTVVVYGPSGCGKSKNSIAIAAAFGLRFIIDAWDKESHIPEKDALVLTNIDLSSEPRFAHIAITFKEAMKRTRPVL